MPLHILAAGLPLLLIAALILVRSALAPLLLLAAWLAAVVAGSRSGASVFKAMFLERVWPGRARRWVQITLWV